MNTAKLIHTYIGERTNWIELERVQSNTFISFDVATCVVFEIFYQPIMGLDYAVHYAIVCNNGLS